MIGDARQVERGTTIEADLCIIGAGAAGITLALALLRSCMRIVLLEAGSEVEDAKAQSLYEGEVAGNSAHSPPDKYRQRRFGGSTTIWGGRCVPLDPIDFKPRAWIPDSGWPISYHEVAAHYPAANALCEAGEATYDAGHAVEGGMRPLIKDFVPLDFTTDGIERFSCPTDFGKRYRHRLASAQSVRLLLHANCTDLIVPTEGNRTERAVVQTLDGNRFEIMADNFVVATGALEAARLLLASRHVHTTGIGNAHGLVGRYYMCHLAGTIGTLRFNRPASDIWHDYERTAEGIYCRRRISLTEAAQQRENVGNLIFRLHHPRIPNPTHGTGALSAIFLARHFISYEYGKRLVTEQRIGFGTWAQHAANVGRDAMGTARFFSHWLRDRMLAERKFPSVIVRPRRNLYSLEFNAEQEPNADSRVRLGDRTDQLGMPRLHIDWRYTEGDVRTVGTAFHLLQRDVTRSGLGDLSLDQDEADIEAIIRRDGACGGHHIGTARMAASPSTGVVDTTCRVFGVSNLYVAGSAVFPTSGQANPTLTIVALSLRLAHHLQTQARALADVFCQPRTQTRCQVRTRDVHPAQCAEHIDRVT